MVQHERKTILISQLLLDPENARHGLIESQVDIINWMILSIGDKLYVLAKDISEHGLSPIDGILVIPSEDAGHFVIVEGNRRITALKLILNPDICEDKKLREKLIQLKSKASYQLPEMVECILVDDFDHAKHWIRLRHGGEHGGMGTVPWGATELERFNKRIDHAGKNAFALKVLDWAKENSLITAEADNNFPITSLTRLLNDNYVRSVIGIIIDSGALKSTADDVEISKIIKRILHDLSQGKIKVDDIKKKEQRSAYIKKIASETLFDISKKANAPFELDGDPEISSDLSNSAIKHKPLAGKQNKSTLDRKVLIPREFKIQIKNHKLNDIYLLELKKLDVDKYPNAVAVLFRVFLEGCLDEFIVKTGLPIHANSSLNSKLSGVTTHLHDNKKITENIKKAVNKAISSTDHVSSIDTFHAYVHNAQFQAAPMGLKLAWNNYQGLFQAMDGAI